MPIYEFQCRNCGATLEVLWRNDTRMADLKCRACNHGELEKIISRPSVHRDTSSKLDSLDPKYDRMVERAVKTTPEADPDKHLSRMKPFNNPKPMTEK